MPRHSTSLRELIVRRDQLKYQISSYDFIIAVIENDQGLSVSHAQLDSISLTDLNPLAFYRDIDILLQCSSSVSSYPADFIQIDSDQKSNVLPFLIKLKSVAESELLQIQGAILSFA